MPHDGTGEQRSAKKYCSREADTGTMSTGSNDADRHADALSG